MIVKPNKKPLIILILFLIVMFIVTFVYITSPNDMKKLNKVRTFEEMLEYNNNNYKKQDAQKNNQTVVLYKNDNLNIPAPPPDYVPTAQPVYTTETKETNLTVKTEADYRNLLTELQNYPARTEDQIQTVVNKLLKYKGYPENTVKVKATDIDQSRAKTKDHYLVANFDFSSGNLRISPKMLYQLGNKELIAILAHELDHFDKLANVCKSVGINQFLKIFNDNDIQINSDFWSQAAHFANDKNFDLKQYEDALKRFISQNEIERTSSFADFYKLTENMRNPLEVSAYKESDYIYDFYKIPQEDGPVKKLTRKFNDVDWAVYNTAAKLPNMKNERIALFDYFFSKAIVNSMPQFDREYQNCLANKNGDMTSFWLAFEKSASKFYNKSELMDNETYNTIYSLLEKTEQLAKNDLTNPEIAQALKMKINTLNSNLVYPNAVKNLRLSILDYLRFIKANDSENNEQELNCIIKLLCIDNDLTKENTDKEISLYNLNFADDLKLLYEIGESKKGRYLFIYNNPAFKQNKGELSEQDYLISLLNKNRLDIRIQK